MFVTSISKLSNSVYLSWTFQLNGGFSKGGLPCLYLCGSLRIAAVAGQDPTSVSLSAILTAVAIQLAAGLTTA